MSGNPRRFPGLSYEGEAALSMLSSSYLGNRSTASPESGVNATPGRSRSDGTPTPGLEGPRVHSEWSRTSSQLSNLRHERDRMEQARMRDIYENGDMEDILEVAGGDPADVDRYVDEDPPPMVTDDMTPAEQHCMDWEPTPTTGASSLRHRGLHRYDQTPTQRNFRDIGSLPRGTPSVRITVDDTTPASAYNYGHNAPNSNYGQHVLEQALNRLQQARNTELRHYQDRASGTIDRRGLQLSLHTRQTRLDEWLDKIQEYNDHLNGEEERESQFKQALADWVGEVGEEAAQHLLKHIDNCTIALPTIRYRALCAFWWDGIPDALRDPLHRLIKAEALSDCLLYEADILYARSQGDEGFQPEDRETWPLRTSGLFGYEFLPDDPHTHICGEDCFCGFIPPERLDLEGGFQGEQRYIAAALDIRFNRMTTSREYLEHDSYGDNTMAREKLMFVAFHCWLDKVLNYIHNRAYHPENLVAQFNAAGAIGSFGDFPEWQAFETTFRETVGSLFAGEKQRAWIERAAITHRNPLTGQTCDEVRSSDDGDPTYSIDPEWLEDERYADDNESVTATPSVRSRTRTATPHQTPSVRRSRPPPSTSSSHPEYNGTPSSYTTAFTHVTPSTYRTAQSHRTPSMEPNPLRASSISATSRHTDNDGDESMVDDEVTPKARESRRQGRYRGHRLDPDRTPTQLDPVLEEDGNVGGSGDYQRQLDSQLGVTWTDEEEQEQDETENLEDEETNTGQDETEDDVNVPDYAVRSSR
ncbi:hypothetical protein PRZ48_008996 [Zasmidium cellare]|uniref:Uncharacterized protein n=1 Tax=Zasmidium cellare TaxID=395010 RepID=A0ABR0EHG3_ZASCE|nr:hypothetical protein PRZ48_008996 [Zasmidium cellare]